MYVFGGRPQGGNPTSDLYVLNLNSLQWTLVDQHQSRSGDQIDTAKASEREHQDGNQHQPSQDAQQSNEVLSSVHNLEDGPPSLVPTPRYHHSAVLVTAPPLINTSGILTGWGDEDAAHMVIFGGRTLHNTSDEAGVRRQEEISLNDTHILDLKTLRWIPSSLSNAYSVARGASVTEEGAASGLQSIDRVPSAMERAADESSQPKSSQDQNQDQNQGKDQEADQAKDKNPTLPATAPDKHDPYRFHTPRQRFAHLASLSGDHMIVFGGRDESNECIHEISILDLKTHVWTKGGISNGDSSRSGATLASADERPMVRRRRRYLECLAVEQCRNQQPMLSISSSSLNTGVATDHGGDGDQHDPLPTTPTSPTAISAPLLNPRRDSWYRGEGHPFEMPHISHDVRLPFKSDSGLSLSIGQEIDGLMKDGQPHIEISPSSKASTINGHDLENESSNTAPTLQQPSATTTSSRGSHKASSMMSIISSGSERSRSRSHSHVSATLSTLSLTSSSGEHQGRTKSNPPTPVTHAVPRKFFAKSNGSMFDFDDLATTIAREQKVIAQQIPVPPLPNIKDGPNKDTTSRGNSFSQLKRHSSTSTSSTSSRRSSGYLDDSKSHWRTQRGGLDGDDKSDKRRSLDSVLDVTSLSDTSFNEDKTNDRLQSFPAPAFQPLFIYSNHMAADGKLKREFSRMQRAKAPYHPMACTTLHDVLPEWTALNLETGGQGESENSLPPRMYFPMAHVVDQCFILSGASVENETTTVEGSSKSKSTIPNHPSETRRPSCSGGSRRPTYSVWMHHLHNHQWTQLELSNSVRTGTWNMSVLDRGNNNLYILGQRFSNRTEEARKVAAPEETTDDESMSITSFTHMIKVDLEGLEICPAVDESSVGPSGVRLGLDMLRDGVGADAVLVSSTDGGRVRVNSGIVGQRWGYFQTLVEERNRIRDKELQEKVASVDETNLKEPLQEGDSDPPLSREDNSGNKQEYLKDQPPLILVPESTPILVGLLQYIYTNELATPHQHKLKTLQGLLLVAHRYDLTRLQQLVKKALYQQLNASNALAIGEIAVLTHEFGLHTRAIRTLLTATRMAQLRRQGEAAEAKRRLDFAMSRMDEYEEERKRKESMQAIHQMMQQVKANADAALMNSNSSSGGFASRLANAGIGFRQGSTVSSSGSTISIPTLSTFGRFFRHKEESNESTGPMV
ncbi:MAG: hypothetical protein J3Q66DRAFT_372234 [Benniella sp.]|nr:MAG: hypothetical protein J3Q66DRAFT_372234 [Benniella sp.]